MRWQLPRTANDDSDCSVPAHGVLALHGNYWSLGCTVVGIFFAAPRRAVAFREGEGCSLVYRKRQGQAPRELHTTRSPRHFSTQR